MIKIIESSSYLSYHSKWNLLANKEESEKMEKEMEISLVEIITILWRKAWLIVLCMVLGGALGFGVSYYAIEPTYTSRISMYVNNNTDRLDSQLNINDINASQKLVATYIEILKSDVVLDKVIAEMGLPYSSDALRGMITANALNSTEILQVKVTSTDPEEAAAIANTLAKLAPPEIIRVVQAGGVQLIDEAVVNTRPVAPNIQLNSIIGVLLGAVISALGVLVAAMLDTRVKSEEDLQKQYEIPVLGVIPDILEAMKTQS